MATTRNLQATINWASAFLRYQPLLIGGQDPALSTANLVLQTILGPPFCWRWNRGSVGPLALGANAQDVAAAIADFGFLEKAWIGVGSTDLKEVTIETSLSQTLETGRPNLVAAQLDDNAGNITFRVMPQTPDATYALSISYQKKAPLMLSVASTWAPVPDEMAYIYEWGFLAIASILLNDPRFPLYNQKFMSHLLGAQEGLDEMRRNIFLGNWLQLTKDLERAQMKTQQGIGARNY